MTPDQFVIGGCLLGPDIVPIVQAQLSPGDFESQPCELLFETIVRLRAEGKEVEPFIVYKEATNAGLKGVDLADLHAWYGTIGSVEAVTHYASMVKDAAIRRRLRAAGTAFHQQVQDEGIPSTETVEKMIDQLRSIRDGATESQLVAKSLGSILDTPDTPEDWVIEGLFERGDRMIVTGWEGLGKTTWLRQIGICAAAGIDPVSLDHLERPIRCLYVDVENSEKQWRRETNSMAAFARNHGRFDPRENVSVYCGKRMDIRSSRDLGMVHRLVDENEPDILFIGPIYRLSPTAINNDEEAAPVIAALDSLRDRGLVLVMEAHAPKGQGGERNLAPRGSAALTGWPEFGFGLAPFTEEQESRNGQGAEVQRWRGERDRRRRWPRQLLKWNADTSLPWVADNVSDHTRQSFMPHKQGTYNGF